jgi:hypothetical protein
MRYVALLAALFATAAFANPEITYRAQPHELWVSQAAIDNGRLDTIGVYYRVKRNDDKPFQIVFLPLTGQPTVITVNDKIKVGVVDVPVYVTIDDPAKETVVRVQYTFVLPSLYMSRPDIYEFPIEVTAE